MPLARRVTLALLALVLAGPLAAQGARAAAPVGSRTVNGADLHYRIVGTGPTLVLLHPFFGCGEIWSPHVAVLSQRHRLVLVDMRGHGRSTNPGGRFSHRQVARDLLGLLDSLGVGRFSAIGASSGAMTLLHVATSLAPARVDAMVLVSGTTEFTEPARAIMRATTSPRAIPPADLATFRACASRGEPQLVELASIFHGFAESRDDVKFGKAELANVKARTLVVHGDADPFFSARIATDLFEGIAGSRLWIIPNGGHVPIFGRRAPAFRDEVQAFLRDASQRASAPAAGRAPR